MDRRGSEFRTGTEPGRGRIWISGTIFYLKLIMKVCNNLIFRLPQALVGINSRRKVYSVLRGPFSDDGIAEYIREMAGGRGRITKFRGESLPPANSVEAWDGRDGEVSDIIKFTISC